VWAIVAQQADGAHGDLTTAGFVAATLAIVVTIVRIVVKRSDREVERGIQREQALDARIKKHVDEAVSASEARCRADMAVMAGDLRLALSGLEVVAGRYPADRDVTILLTALRARNGG